MTKIDVFGFVLGVIGFCLLWLVDWRLAVGVYLLTWGNNLYLVSVVRRHGLALFLSGKAKGK